MVNDKNITQENESGNKAPQQPVQEPIKKNPNPRANENIEEDKRQQPSNTGGTGTEITDGEDG
jgi:hypothetical protein